MNNNSKIKIACVVDQLTQFCLEDYNIRHVTPLTYRFVFKFWKPDILFVESVWNGYKNSWKYKVASYPEVLKRNNNILIRMVNYAKQLGIKTVFWNKEDIGHFNRFISSAKHFDFIFTIDENAIKDYVKQGVNKNFVDVFPFCINPKLHNFSGITSRCCEALFIGSYNSILHPQRFARQTILFNATRTANFPLLVVDRNSERKSNNYRYPDWIKVLPSVSYDKTAEFYKKYLVCFNVNTIENSPTMYSRRFIEILACGGFAVTTPALSIQKIFKDYCCIVKEEDEVVEILNRLKIDGYSKKDIDMMTSASSFVLEKFNWNYRFNNLLERIGV